MKKGAKVGLSLLSILMLASCHHDLPSSSATTQPPVTEPAPTVKPTETPTEAPTEKTTETPTVKPAESASVEAEKYDLSVEAGEGATISSLPDKVEEGKEVTFSVTLAAEKVLSYVTIDGENTLDANENGVYSFIRPKHAVKISAITADKTYANNVIQVDGATVAVSSTSAKKGAIITVRVSISDSNKVSPVVKAGEADVDRTAVGDASLKTFEGTFAQPGKDIDITTTLTSAAAKYAIVDKSGDGAVVSGPTSAAKGEKVSFRLSLEEGVEFSGDVKVYKEGEEATVLDVTNAEDGSYSFIRPDYAVVIERKTVASVFAIKVEGDGKKIEASAVTCPEYAVYGSKVTLSAKGNEKYLVDKILVDGTEAAYDAETDSYSFTMPTHAVVVKVVSKVHYYPVTLVDSKHITLSAFTQDAETKAYTPITAQGITYNDHVFVKATAKKGDDGKEYAVDTRTTKRSKYDSGTVRTLNSDGYYASNATSPSDDKFGVKIEVTEGEMVLKEDSILLGTHSGVYKSSSYVSTESLTLSQIGKGKLGYSEVTRSDYNESAKTFKLNSGSSSYDSGYFDSGLIYVNEQTYSPSVLNVHFYLSRTSSLPVKNIILDNSYSYNANKSLAEIGDGTRTVYGFVEKSGSKRTIKNVTIAFKKETSISTKGAIFEIKDGETSLGYFQNKDGVLASYAVRSGTYTGDEGSLTLDGFGKATLVKDDVTKEGSYILNGDYMSLTVEGKDFFLKLNGNTYTAVDYVVGDFYGAKIAGDDDVTEWHLLNDFTTKAVSSYANPGTFNEKGQFTSSSRTLLSLSPDKKAFVMRYANDYYLMSSDPDDSVSSHIEFNDIGDKTAFVASISGTSQEKVVSSVYFDGADFHWGTISDSKFTTDGTSFTFQESAEKIFHLFNNEGKVGVLDGLAGTYTNATLGNLVLDGKGAGKLGDTAITYAVNEDKTLTVTAGEKTYTVTLGAGTYTYKEEAKSIVPAWLAGKTFYSANALQSEDGDEESGYIYNDEPMAIVFSATELKLSTSAGYGCTSAKPLGGSYLQTKEIDYTITENILSFELKGQTLKITLDEENKTFSFSETVDVAGFTTRMSGTFNVVK